MGRIKDLGVFAPTLKEFFTNEAGKGVKGTGASAPASVGKRIGQQQPLIKAGPKTKNPPPEGSIDRFLKGDQEAKKEIEKWGRQFPDDFDIVKKYIQDIFFGRTHESAKNEAPGKRTGIAFRQSMRDDPMNKPDSAAVADPALADSPFPQQPGVKPTVTAPVKPIGPTGGKNPAGPGGNPKTTIMLDPLEPPKGTPQWKKWKADKDWKASFED